MPTVLTVIGNTGEGKSTVVNDIVGANVCPARGGLCSITTAITGWEVADANLTVYDTPGLGDTDGRSEEFFLAITDHLHKHGGVLAFVQSQARMNPILKNRLKALSMILSGSSFTNCCVLITTKYSPEGNDEEDAEQSLREYETGLERELSAIFSQRYAYNKYIPETRAGFVAIIKENITDLEGLKPGEVLTWSQVIRLAEGDVTEAVEQTKLLEQQVTQLQSAIEQTKANKRNYESWGYTILNGAATVADTVGGAANYLATKVGGAATTVATTIGIGGVAATVADSLIPDTILPVVSTSGGTIMVSIATIGTVAVGYIAKNNRDAAMKMVKKLTKDQEQLNLQLKDAKQQLAQVDISALVARAREIRELVQ